MGVLVGLTGISLVSMAYLKATYETGMLSGLTQAIYHSFPPYRFLWPWLPKADPFDHFFGFLLNGPVLLGLCLFVIGAVFARRCKAQLRQ